MCGAHIVTLQLLTCMFPLTSVSLIETTNTSGTFTSPNYPGQYGPNANETHVVRVEDIRNFTITISNFSVECTKGCRGDSLTVYPLLQSSDSIILAPLCGRIQDELSDWCIFPANGSLTYQTSLTMSVLSSGFEVRFVSDESGESTGFVFSYSSTLATSDEVCNGMIQRMNDGSTVISPSFLHDPNSYPLNVTCDWPFNNYTTDANHSVVVNITDFSIEDSGPSCVSDYLEIRNTSVDDPNTSMADRNTGMDDRNTSMDDQNTSMDDQNHTQETLDARNVLIKLCGSFPDSYTKSFDDIQHGVHVTFTSDGRNNNGNFRLAISLSAKHLLHILHREITEIRITDSRIHNLSLNEIVLANPCPVHYQTCEHIMTLVVDPGYQIHAQLSEVLNQSGIVTIYEGPSTDFPIMKYNHYDTTVFTSQGFSVTFSFTVNDMQSGKLYSFMYSAHSGILDNRDYLEPCKLTLAVEYELSLNMATNVKVTTGSNYFCHVAVTALRGYAISMKMHHYTSPPSTTCESSGVVVFDGSTDNRTKLGPFCEIENGYVKAMFDPLLTSSNEAYIVMYSYVRTNEEINRTFSMDLSAYECRGIHIFSNHGQISFHPTDSMTTFGMSHMTNSTVSPNTVSVNMQKIQQKQKCTIIIFHVSLQMTGNVRQEFKLDKRENKLCDYFGELVGRDTGDFTCDKVECCSTVDYDITNITIQSIARGKAQFQKLFIGLPDRDPAKLTATCRVNPDRYTPRNTIHQIYGQISAYGKKTSGCSACSITMIYDFSQGKFPLRYILISVRVSLRSYEIVEKLGWMFTKTIVYNNGIPAHRYRSISHKYIEIRLTSRYSVADMLYQVQPYTSVPIIYGSINTIVRVGPYNIPMPKLRYMNHIYEIHSVNKYDGTSRYLQTVCQTNGGGSLFNPSTSDELEAIKTALSTHWDLIPWWYLAIPIPIGLRKQKQQDGRDQWIWPDGAPLTFSDWYYPDDIDHKLPSFTKEKIGRRAMEVQPNPGDVYRCAYMLMSHPRMSTNWFSVNCEDMPEETIVICENVVNDTWSNETDIESLKKYVSISPVRDNAEMYYDNSNVTYKNQQFHVNVTCPVNWIFADDQCWLLLLYKFDAYNDDVYSFTAAEKDCGVFGGRVADVRDVGDVIWYLTSANHRAIYGGIWITTNGSKSCLLYRQERDLMESEMDRLELKTGHKSHECIHMDYHTDKRGCTLDDDTYDITCGPTHVFCVRDVEPITQTCRVGYLQCFDGSCLSPDLVCDGVNDCVSGEDERNCDIVDYFYQCVTGSERIAISKYCDYSRDCRDGSDEEGCVHPACGPGEVRCDSGQCVSGSVWCNGKQDGCLDYSDESWCRSKGNCSTNGFFCGDGACIERSRELDVRRDCDDMSDEPMAHTYEAKEVLNNCDVVEGQCAEHNIVCFTRDETCVLGYDMDGRKRGCSNGEHLANCASFQCPGRYKCPDSYCIDMKRVCNGIQDCQYGEDEAECDDTRCPGLYRCGGDQTFCLDRKAICNGDFDCTFHYSDEKYCNLPVCPTGCICHGYFYNCKGNKMSGISVNISNLARTLNLETNNLGMVIRNNYTFSHFPYLAVLRLSNNQIDELYRNTFDSLYNLITLDLSHNLITSLHSELFRHLVKLQNLILAGNTITILLPKTFYGLLNLPTLNLSNLGIRELQSGSLNGLKSLKTLILSANVINIIENGVFHRTYIFDLVQLVGNDLSHVPIDVFRDITSQVIEASEFRFCCYTNYKNSCTPSVDVYSSCDDLMSNRFLQVIIWVIGSLSVLGNVSVIIARLIIGLKGPSEICIFALSFSDLLTGIYLIIIASVDSIHRGDYIIHDIEWKSSTLCKICGVLSTLSAQLSSLLLLLITLDRFIHLVFPMKVVPYKRKSTIIVILVMCLVSLVESVIPIMIPSYFGENFYGKTPLCLAFDFTDGRSPGWEYTMTVFVLLNLLNCFLILLCYVIIYISIRDSSKRVDPKRKEDIALAKTLFLLVLTNLICWFPLIITSLSVINGSKVTRDMAALLTVVVLPINAALNPYLYTISTIQKAVKTRKKQKAPATQSSSLSKKGSSESQKGSSVSTRPPSGHLSPRTFRS